ncbi:MAG: nicotinate-nucleotide adenylyltransferase [Rickettsiaceae bacterium]
MEVTNKIYNLQSLNFLKDTKLKIGVLGGSFNPAHYGHLLISKQAIDIYKCDYVIWLVAKQNPLKTRYKDSIYKRAEQAARIVVHPRIIVSSVEDEFGMRYLYDSLRKLIVSFPSNNFRWLMGVDNLTNFHKWYRYEEIPKLCKIILFDRPVKERFINNSQFNLKYKRILAKTQTNNIMIYKGVMCSASSSQIKSSLE